MPCPDLPAEPATVVFDADGDLVLNVGITKCEQYPFAGVHISHVHNVASAFRVCSRAMARASPVWRSMLFGGFAESKPTSGNWVVNLPDDSPQAMSTLLGIVHAKFDDVPQTVGPHELFDIAVIADKYDLTHLLKPWARVWLDQAWEQGKKHFQSSILLLWITWVLGDQNYFVSTAKWLALNMKSEYLFKLSLYIPPDVSERIIKTHYDTIATLLQPWEQLYLHVSGADSSSASNGEAHGYCSFCGDDNPDKCHTLLLGFLQRSFREAHLFPEFARSIMLGKTASKMALYLKHTASRIPVLVSAHWSSHTIVANAAEGINKVMGSVRFELTESEIKHLRAQGMKTGLCPQ
ncbi:hypothetical protein PG993_011050 [Apiospora rasikravindrae]|uniref:BTB domain-containing protein n=1 Tax=Apiospora rasikravindrae TaxID=990691 RepID=A0ABR1SEV9_9PEZI